MRLTQTIFFKAFLAPLLFALCLGVVYYSYRFTALVLLVVLVVSYVRFLSTAKTRWMKVIFVGVLVAAFLPIDVWPVNVPGPPRFVPLIMGMPGPEESARAKRGDAILGGCLVSGNEPRWILVL